MKAKRLIFSIVIVCFAFASFFALPAIASAKTLVVSMGDSFSAGEGCPPFYGQNGDKENNQDWLAHRSENSWPGKLVVDGKTMRDLKKSGEWRFVASSGAVTSDFKSRQKKEVKTAATKKKVDKYVTAQMKVFDKIKDKDSVKYVTLTIGGNDLGFSDIITKAFFSSQLFGDGLKDQIDEKIKLYDSEVKNRMVNVYKGIRKEAPNAAIIVAGYPYLIDDSGSFSIPKGEARVINNGVKKYDTKTKALIESLSTSGYNGDKIDNIHYVSVINNFRTHEAYSDDPYINPVIKLAKEQDLTQSPPSAYSIHPNWCGREKCGNNGIDCGVSAYADAVQEKIDELEKKRPAATPSQNNTTPADNSQPATKPAKDKDSSNSATPISNNVSLSMIVDISGSMDSYSAYENSTKLEAAKRQSTDFVSSLSGFSNQIGSAIEVGVGCFDDRAASVLDPTADYDTVNDAISSLSSDGRTNILDGLAVGIKQLENKDGDKIMVFLSDGMDTCGNSRESILALADEAAQKGIKIYTIGFGKAGDFDEDVLQGIADATGGIYSHEDPNSLASAGVGIFAMMTKAMYSNNNTVLAEQQSALAQGETSEAVKFTVDQNGVVYVTLYWPGSNMEINLTDPNGKQVGAGYAGYSVISDSIPKQIKIENAPKGDWTMSVYGEEVSMEKEPFYAIAAFEESQNMAAPAGGGSPNYGNTMLAFLVVVAGCAIVGVAVLSSRNRKKTEQNKPKSKK